MHVISGLDTGGAEMTLYRILKSLQGSGLTFVVVSLRDRGTMGDRIEALGVPVHSLYLHRSGPDRIARGCARLLRISAAARPDVVQGWMYHGNLCALLAARFGVGRPAIVWNIRHSLDAVHSEKWATRWLIRLTARFSRRCATVIYNSFRSARQHEEAGYARSRTLVIPNGFDCRTFKPSACSSRSVRAELGIGDQEVVIGLFGRYHPIKDHRTFLHAAAQLIADQHGVRFVLAGRRVDKANPELVALCDRYGLTDEVVLLGERDDMPRLTAAVDIACCSSRGEAFPNVLGEAMAAGVPCVSTDVGDARAILGETGTIVMPGDPAALANAWRRLIRIGNTGRKRLGMAARRRVMERFDLLGISAQYRRLYEGLVKG